MERKRIMHNNGQSTIEFTLIFVIIAALVIGLLSIWKWSVNNIVVRQQSYNSQRLGAGSSSPGSPEIAYTAPNVNVIK